MRNLIVILILAVLATACGSKPESSDDRPVVAVTSAPERMLVERIAGDRVRVVTLLPPGADAEHFDPSVSTMRALSDATVWFTLGTPGFESDLARRLPANFPDLQIVNVADGIEPLEGTHEAGDPHLTASLVNLQAIAQTMTDHLSRLLPDDEESLRENNAALQRTLAVPPRSHTVPPRSRAEGPPQPVHREAVSDRGCAPQRAFVVLHPNLSYFARDNDLRQIPLERDGKEPTPAAMGAALREARAAGATLLVLDAAHPNDAVADLAHREGLRVLTLPLNDTAVVTSLRTLSLEILR